MVVQHNLSAFNANRMLGVSTGSIGKSSEKLSSGYKINRAADDAAGLTISEKMRSQIRGLTQASDNTQDGVSFCQIADGALNEVQDMLKRCTELAVKASNGTNTDADREAIQQEIGQISDEIDKVHQSSLFNELRVFPDGGDHPDTVISADVALRAGKLSREVEAGNTTITLEFIDTEGNIATVQQSSPTGKTNPTSAEFTAMADFVVGAAASAVEKLSQNFSGLFAKSSSSNVKIGLELSDQAVGGVLATANMSISSGGSSSVTSYKMWVDTKDYPIESFATMSAERKADLAATISHEMTHLVMYDTLTSGMLGNAFPDWFVEGMAQTSSGDNGRMSGINPSNDTAIDNFRSKMMTDVYGAGYAACMYLGYVAGGGSAVDKATIISGLNSVLTKTAENIADNKMDGKSALDAAIKDATGGTFSGISDFQSKFMSGSAAHDFVKNLITERGTTGAGSLLGNSLGQTEAAAFASPLSGSYGSYQIQKDSEWYSNGFGTGFVFPKDLPSSGGDAGGKGNDRNGFIIQAGAANRSEQQIFVRQFNISNESLFDGMKMDASTIEGALDTIGLAQRADAKISAVRSYYGGMQNRLEHTIANLDNIVENTTAAESQIRDTDMAKEMVNYTKTNVLIQAGNAMLTQAMQTPQNVLQLLQ